jgi:deazaflavin-dependent oxidoreductase (nitroreductase family)
LILASAATSAMALQADLAREATCDLVSTGRTSGQPRQIEIWFAADPERDRIYLLSGGRDRANWVRNIAQEPRVRVRIADRWFDGVAAVVEGAVDDPLVRRLLATKYQGWSEGRPLSDWARESLPVAIDIRPGDLTGEPLLDS